MPASEKRTRRAVLLSGLGLTALGATVMLPGCTVTDPRVAGSGAPVRSRTPGATATATPTPAATFPGAAESATVERRLASRAGGLLNGRTAEDLSRRRRRLLEGLRSVHLTHAAALHGPDPTTRVPGPSATPRPAEPGPSLERSLRRLVRAEAAAARTHQQTALAATGFSCLLYASMSITAASLAAAVSSDEAVVISAVDSPRPMPQLSDTAATQELVRQLHAIIYGYQLAIGQLKVGSASHGRAVARLREHRVLRDRLIARLIERSAEVPVSEPAYAPPVRPRNPATSAELIKTMEVALAPFCGLWLASVSTPAERAQAFAVLARTVEVGRQWGAPITVWPGWTA